MNQRGRVFKIKISMTFLYPKLIGCLNSLSLLHYPYINIMTSTSCGLFWIEIKWFTRFSLVKMKWKNCQNELWISKYIIEVVDTSSMESSWRTYTYIYCCLFARSRLGLPAMFPLLPLLLIFPPTPSQTSSPGKT